MCCPYTVCLLFWIAKLETSHVLQSNKNQWYGVDTRLSVSILVEEDDDDDPQVITALLRIFSVLTLYEFHCFYFSQALAVKYTVCIEQVVCPIITSLLM